MAVPEERPHESSQENDLANFLAQLPTLWREGDPRPTHREPPTKRRYWRTREDPFESAWTEVESWLEHEPDITAKALFPTAHREVPRHVQRWPGADPSTAWVREWRKAMARLLIFGEPTAVAQGIESPMPDQCSVDNLLGHNEPRFRHLNRVPRASDRATIDEKLNGNILS